MPNANSVSVNADLARLFSALGDPTRLSLVMSLSTKESLSISALSQGSNLSRQAITKHLRILEAKSIITSTKSGRETHFSLKTERIDELSLFLSSVSKKWDNALQRLRTHVE